jgi:REP-associated tyrosine transposase
MPRVARGLADGMIYHVINRGNARQEVFHKDEDFHAFEGLLGEAKDKHPVRVTKGDRLLI